MWGESMDVDVWLNKAKEALAAINVDEIRQTGILPDGGKKFFPVIGYPPLTMYTEMDQSSLFEDFNQRAERPLSAYIHIPFCPTRCTFCHWITKTKSLAEEVDVYLDYLEKEMQLYKTQMGVEKIPAQSVLIGGGTPTYLDVAQTERFYQMIHKHYDLSQCTQFSVEAEPTTIIGDEGLAKLKVMKAHGVDRISLGVQSFDDPILKYMGRAHSHAQTLESIETMRKAEIDNIFIDLIYAYPNQTVEDWARNMLLATTLDIEGYQLYRLRIKQHGDRKGNIIREFNKRPERFATVDEVLQMKMLGKVISEENGFHEYQARIFAKKENYMSHYLRDWTNELYDVAGVGVSAWSNLRGVFALNVGDQSLQSYYDLIDQGKVAVNRGKIRSADDEIRRSFLLPLKNIKVDKSVFTQRTGKTIGELFQAEIDWLKQYDLITEDENHVWLTPRGRFFADEVTTQFFNPAYLPFPDVAQISKMVASG